MAFERKNKKGMFNYRYRRQEPHIFTSKLKKYITIITRDSTHANKTLLFVVVVFFIVPCIFYLNAGFPTYINFC